MDQQVTYMSSWRNDNEANKTTACIYYGIYCDNVACFPVLEERMVEPN